MAGREVALPVMFRLLCQPSCGTARDGSLSGSMSALGYSLPCGACVMSGTRRGTAVCGPSGHGGSRPTAGFLAGADKRTAAVPAAPSETRVFQALPSAGGHAGVADGGFASRPPGFDGGLLLVDSAPAECARSRETVKPSALDDAADYGYCSSHSRFLPGVSAARAVRSDGTAITVQITRPKNGARDIAPGLLARSPYGRKLAVIGVRGCAAATSNPPPGNSEQPSSARTKTKAPHYPRLAPIRELVESIFRTVKDVLTLEQHGARTFPGRRESPRASAPWQQR